MNYKIILLLLLLIVIILLVIRIGRNESYKNDNPTCDNDIYKDQVFDLQGICSDLFPDVCPAGVTLKDVASMALSNYIPDGYTYDMSSFGIPVQSVSFLQPSIVFMSLAGSLYPCQTLGSCCGAVFNGIAYKNTCLIFDLNLQIRAQSIDCLAVIPILGPKNLSVSGSIMNIGAKVLWTLDCSLGAFKIQDAFVDDSSSWTADPNTLGKVINALNNSMYKNKVKEMFRQMILTSTISIPVPEEMKNLLCF